LSSVARLAIRPTGCYDLRTLDLEGM